MARAIGDFTSQNPAEDEPFGFDFTTQLASGDSIASLVAWGVNVVVGSDADAPTKFGPNSIVGNIVTTMWGPALPGVEYDLYATVRTTAGATLTLWASLKGVAIGDCGC